MVLPRWYFLSIHEEIGRAIVDIRTYRGYSQEYLALECDMSVSYLRRIEHGTANPTIDKLSHIAKVLEVDFRNPFCVPETAGATV